MLMESDFLVYGEDVLMDVEEEVVAVKTACVPVRLSPVAIGTNDTMLL